MCVLHMAGHGRSMMHVRQVLASDSAIGMHYHSSLASVLFGVLGEVGCAALGCQSCSRRLFEHAYMQTAHLVGAQRLHCMEAVHAQHDRLRKLIQLQLLPAMSAAGNRQHWNQRSMTAAAAVWPVQQHVH